MEPTEEMNPSEVRYKYDNILQYIKLYFLIVQNETLVIKSTEWRLEGNVKLTEWLSSAIHLLSRPFI